MFILPGDTTVFHRLKEFNFWKNESFVCKLNEGAEAATSSYSATGDILQYIYFVLVATNHQKICSRCLFYEFPSQIFFNDINMVTEQL